MRDLLAQVDAAEADQIAARQEIERAFRLPLSGLIEPAAMPITDLPLSVLGRDFHISIGGLK